MPFRSISRSAICLTAAFGVMVIQTAALAQTADLRSGGDATDINPTPLSAAPDASPDTVSPTVPNPQPARADTLAPMASQKVPDDPGAPNYAKPRPKKAKLFKPNAKTSPPLAALVPYRGAPGFSKTLNPAPASGDTVDASVPAPTIAVIPSPDRRRRPIVEDDPYAPTGVAAGTLRLFPFVETSGGYETNPNQTTTAVRASPVLRASGGLDVRSDFSANSLTATLRGGYTDFPRNSQANRPDASGLVDSRIDVTRNDKIDLEGRFTLSTQTPGSPLLAVPGSVFITDRPSIVTEGATIGATHVFNRLSLNLRGTVDRTEYGDASQSDGTEFRFSQDNYNDFGVIARASYELTPALIPFVETGFDSRVRDHTLDLSGYARSSTGETARVGSTFEFSRLLNGTASAGFAQRHYADPRLVDLRGPTADGSLIYTITPITKATLSANTTLGETTLAGASGAISRSISLELAHIFFRNFTVSGSVTYQVNQYQGVTVGETFTQESLKAAYSLTRDVQVIASASHQRLDSSLQGSSFTDTMFLVGMRLQR